eukprot:2671402-Rhodomonas_salina.1
MSSYHPFSSLFQNSTAHSKHRTIRCDSTAPRTASALADRTICDVSKAQRIASMRSVFRTIRNVSTAQRISKRVTFYAVGASSLQFYLLSISGTVMR